MLAQITTFLRGLDPQTGAILSGLIVHYLAIRDRLTKLETKLADQEKDIDGIGLFIGTPRAIARAAAVKDEPK